MQTFKIVFYDKSGRKLCPFKSSLPFRVAQRALVRWMSIAPMGFTPAVEVV